jgi:CubicO group peptidase (beta-lactamase class C family)
MKANPWTATPAGRRRLAIGSVAVTLTLAVAWTSMSTAPAARARAAGDSRAAAIVAIARQAMKTDHLRAVIVRVTIGGRPIVTAALGESLPGVPATTAMHFRNGAVAYSYVSTLLMEFVDEHKVSLNDPVGRWMPDLPEASQVTLKMLANMTSGYPDYETDKTFTDEFYADPFRRFTVAERLKLAFSRDVSFPPGTNWGYAHTNYMILGEILAKIGHKPLAALLAQKVLRPLHLTNTVASETGAIPSPVLHAFSSERAPSFGITPVSRLYEESTFWNAAWGTPPGATETTDIADMTRTAVGIGSGELLSPESYQAQTGPNLLGFGHPQDGCSCGQMTERYNYGLGIVRSGSWLLQNPLLGGYGAVEAYLPSKKIAIAVAVTFDPGAFRADGNYANGGDAIFRAIGKYLAPTDAPPVKS